MKSSFFLNEKKNNEFSRCLETLKKIIQNVNNNKQNDFNPNIFNNNREYKFSDDITIENLIYKMQRLYFEEINSTLFQNYYIELVKLLIEARNQINNMYSNEANYKFIKYKGIECIINQKELTKKIKNIYPEKLKKIILKSFEYNNLNKKCISMKYELIIQYYLLSHIEDNFPLKLKLYELITLIDNLDESLFKGSNKEANISKETVEKMISIMRISNNIFPFGPCDITNFFKIAPYFFSLMNIMNYKESKEEIQYILFYFEKNLKNNDCLSMSNLANQPLNINSLNTFAQINSPEMFFSKINEWIKRKDYERTKFMITFHDYGRKRNKMISILEKLKTLFSNEKKKRIK